MSLEGDFLMQNEDASRSVALSDMKSDEVESLLQFLLCMMPRSELFKFVLYVSPEDTVFVDMKVVRTLWFNYLSEIAEEKHRCVQKEDCSSFPLFPIENWDIKKHKKNDKKNRLYLMIEDICNMDYLNIKKFRDNHRIRNNKFRENSRSKTIDRGFSRDHISWHRSISDE